MPSILDITTLFKDALDTAKPRGSNPLFSCFIVVLNRGIGFPIKDVIPFQLMPDVIRDSKVAVYNDIVIVARSSPAKNYSHSAARNISFSLEFFAAPEAGLRAFDPVVIKTRIDALRALVYPDYSKFIVQPPPRCIVHIGSQVAFLGVCKSVNVTYTNQAPWDTFPIVLAHHAKVDLVFEEALNIPLSNTEVRIGSPVSFSGNEFASNFGGLGGNSSSSSIPSGQVDVTTSFGNVVG